MDINILQNFLRFKGKIKSSDRNFVRSDLKTRLNRSAVANWLHISKPPQLVSIKSTYTGFFRNCVTVGWWGFTAPRSRRVLHYVASHRLAGAHNWAKVATVHFSCYLYTSTRHCYILNPFIYRQNKFCT